VNLTDLREVLDERSATDHVQARSHMLLSGVHQRIAIRRRNRQIAASAVVVVAVVGLGAAVQVANRPTDSSGRPAAQGRVPTINGFPEYSDGYRVIAASTPVAPTATSIRLPFTPTTIDIALQFRCDDPDRDFDIKLNGLAMFANCGATWVSDTETSSIFGIHAGQPNNVTITFSHGVPANFAVAVGEKVDRDEYALPDRPAILPPLAAESGNMEISLDQGVTYRTTHLVRADSANPNQPVGLSFGWGKGVHLVLISQTPGALDVSVNGARVAQGEWWDYHQKVVDGGSDKSWALTARPERGANATITVIPQRMSGDWAVAIQE
jgi:hypothetical protein